MALAYALQTRIDLGVYVVALQRIAHEPCYLHLRRLNALARCAQKHPLQLKYGAMKCSQLLEAHSDAGFRKEAKDGGVETGRSQRGANFIRVSKSPVQAKRARATSLTGTAVL